MAVLELSVLIILIIIALFIITALAVLLLYDVRLECSLKGKARKPHDAPQAGDISPKGLSGEKREIPFGSSVLIMGSESEAVHRFLKDNFDEKCHEIVFSRVSEKILREKYEFRKNCTFFWVTHKPESDFQISVTDISKLFWNIKQVAINLKRTVIFIDCIEYLVFINSFSPVMRMINEVIDLVSGLQIVFVIMVDPRAFEEKELTLLERSIGILYDERRPK